MAKQINFKRSIPSGTHAGALAGCSCSNPKSNPGPAASVGVAACPPCPAGQRSFWNYETRRWDCAVSIPPWASGGPSGRPSWPCEQGMPMRKPDGSTACGKPCNWSWGVGTPIPTAPAPAPRRKPYAIWPFAPKAIYPF